MVMYIDTSALLKRYIREHDSDAAIDLMSADPVVVTCRLTEVEMRRNLSRLLDPESAARAKRQFIEDLDALALIAIDATTCNEASRIAEQTGCRSLDAIHLSAASRAGSATTLLTFDVRQAQAARSIGLHVLGT